MESEDYGTINNQINDSVNINTYKNIENYMIIEENSEVDSTPDEVSIIEYICDEHIDNNKVNYYNFIKEEDEFLQN